MIRVGVDDGGRVGIAGECGGVRGSEPKVREAGGMTGGFQWPV